MRVLKRSRSLSPRLVDAALESRELLTGSGVSVSLNYGILNAVGTQAGDVATFSHQGGDIVLAVSNANGEDVFRFPDTSVSLVAYEGGAGSDTITNATEKPGYLFGGDGNNTLNGGSGQTYLVSQGAGSNTLNDGAGTTYNYVAGSGSTTVNAGSGYDFVITVGGVNTLNLKASDVVIDAGGTDTVNGGATVYRWR